MSKRKTQESFKESGVYQHSAPPPHHHKPKNKKRKHDEYFGEQTTVLQKLNRDVKKLSRDWLRKAAIASLGILVTGLIAPIAKADDVPKQIYITQVQITGGSGKTDNDFIELYNPNETEVNLKNYRLVKRSSTGSKDTSIKSWSDDTVMLPHHFYLWANSNFTSIIKIPDTVTSSTLADDNGVALRFGVNDTGVLIDSIAWGQTNASFQNVTALNPGPGESVLKQDPNDPSTFTITQANPRNAADEYIKQATDSNDNDTPSPSDTTGDEMNDGTSNDQSDTGQSQEGDDSSNGNNSEESQEPGDSQSTDDTTSDQGGTDQQDQSNDSQSSEDNGAPDQQDNQGQSPDNDSTTTDQDQNNDDQSGSEEIPTQSNSIIISEILANPTGDDTGHEAIELLNSGSNPVNIHNWILDDKSTTGTIGKDAYHIGDIVLLPGQLSVLTIPSTGFVLNNTSDEVNLYDSTGQLVDKVAYSSTKEGLSYQKIDATWFYLPPSLGAPNTASDYEAHKMIVISEVMPNPKGSDDGAEWVELYNKGTEVVDLSGFIIDNLHVSSGVGSSAAKIDDGTIIQPGEYKQLLLPEEAFNFKNTGQDAVRLYDSNQLILQELLFNNVAEGRTYAMDQNGMWQVAWPTPNAANLITLPEIPLMVNEVFSRPASDEQTKFIELYNSGTEDVDVTEMTLQVGTKTIDLNDYVSIIPAKQYLLIDDADILISTSGEVKLLGSYGQVISAVKYIATPKGASWSKIGDEYHWVIPTPGLINQDRKVQSIVKPVTTVVSVVTPKQLQATIKAVTIATNASKTTEVKQKTSKTTSKPTNVSNKTSTKTTIKTIAQTVTPTTAPKDDETLNQEIHTSPENGHISASNEDAEAPKPMPWNYLVVGGVGLCGAGFLAKKYTGEGEEENASNEEDHQV